jgi:uncharacterized protein YbbK (DUF523 family)
VSRLVGEEKESVLISACLLGENVKYDGKNNLIELSLLEKLKSKYNLIPICPEVDGKLPIPRVPSEIVEDKVFNKNGKDVTKNFKLGATLALQTAQTHNCKKAILKSNSPSCGKDQVYDGTFSKTLKAGFGITSALLVKNGIKVLDENDIWQD